MKVPAEIDFHNHTALQMRDKLEHIWSRRTWHGLPRVRIIHGRGEVLIPELRRWCEDKGIDWSPEPGNPGATFIYPGRRVLPATGPTNRIASPDLKALRNKLAARQKTQTECTAPSSRRDLLSSSNRSESAKRQHERHENDDELFAAEIGRIESEQSRSILRNKHGR